MTMAAARTERQEGVDEILELVQYEPWPLQRPILEADQRFIVATGGEQAGKSLLGSKIWLVRWGEDQSIHEGFGDGDGEPLLYWLLGDVYGETVKEFRYIEDDLRVLGFPVDASKRVDPGLLLVRYPNEAKPRIRIETKSGTDLRRMSKEAPHGIIICEPAQCDVEMFERARTRLAPHHGWLLMMGTLERESGGWFAQLAAAWRSGMDDRKSFELPTWANLTMYPGGRNDPKILEEERDASDEHFMARLAGKVTPPRGLVFPEFRPDIHIQECDWVEGETVYIWEDPGYGSEHTHAIELAQIRNGQVRVFDELYTRNLITEELIAHLKNRPWWGLCPKVLVTDPNYKTQHHSMPSVAEQWLKDTGMVAGGRKARINEGTERLKGFLKPDPITREPKIIFSPNCKGVLSELGAHPSPHDGKMHVYRWDVDREGIQIHETPHDSNNDGLKAIIYGITDHFGVGYAGQKQLKVTYW